MTFDLQQVQAQLLKSMGETNLRLPLPAQQMLLDAGQVFSALEVERAMDRLAVQLTVDLQDQDPMFISVLPHGLVFAGMLMTRLAFPLLLTSVALAEDDSSEVTFISGQFSPAKATEHLDGRKIVLLTTMVQTAPLGSVENWLRAQGAASVSTAVVIDDIDQSQADYTALSISPKPGQVSEWFGCGFSVQGYGANLPGIYCLAPQNKVSNT